MKIVRAQTKRQWFVFTLIAILLVGALFVLEKAHVTDFIKNPTQQHSAQQGPTESQEAQDNQIAAQEKQRAADTAKNNQDQSVPIPTSPDTIQLVPFQAGGTVTLTTKLSGQGYASGTCVLTVANGTKTVTKTAEIMYQPEYSTCAGFSLLTSELGSGIWSFSLKVTPTGGSSLTNQITLEII